MIMRLKDQLVTPAWKWLFPLLLVTAGVVAYSNSLYGVFLLDDASSIVANPDVRQVWPLKLQTRCVVDLTFKLTYAVGELNPAYYHAFNILIHIFSGLLLYGIVRRTLLRQGFSGHLREASSWLALFTAAIWIVHPLQTESVTYICQRYESMMGLFFLLALYCFLRGADSLSYGQRIWFDLAVLACALGMGTKEVMVAAAVIIMLYDYFFIAGSLRELFSQRWRVHAAVFCCWGILFVLMLRTACDNICRGSITFTQMSPWTYLGTQFGVIVHYLRLVFLPHPLCLDYSWLPVEHLDEVVLPGLFIVGLAGLSIWAMKRRMAFGFPLTWFFVILAPTSSFMPVGDMAFEHRMYLPLAGIVVLVITGGYLALMRFSVFLPNSQRGLRITGAFFASAIVLVLSGMTIQRNALYGSAELMWRDVVTNRQDNPRAMSSLSSELLKNGKAAEAEEVTCRLVEYLKRAERSSGSKYRMEPKLVSYYASLANEQLGSALFRQGKMDQALGHFLEIIAAKPGDTDARHNYAIILQVLGRTNESIVELNRILEVQPGRGRTHALLAFILSQQGKFTEAVRHYRKALELAPDISAKTELAWLLASCPIDEIRNGKEAVELAASVCVETSFLSSKALDVLAAAYAETGIYDKALENIMRALKLAKDEEMALKPDTSAGRTTGQSESVQSRNIEAMEERMKLYMEKKPFRIGLRQGAQ